MPTPLERVEGGEKESRLQDQVRAEILHVAGVIKSDREAVKKLLSASLTSTRVQIRASEEAVQAVKHRLSSTQNLLRVQYGYQLLASQHYSTAASSNANAMEPKPSKVKVQNLLIRPEHLARLPNPAPPRPAPAPKPRYKTPRTRSSRDTRGTTWCQPGKGRPTSAPWRHPSLPNSS